MNKNGPIIVIDDDPDDRYILENIFTNLNIANVAMFKDGIQAYEYLNTGHADPFIIICDINMPKMSGIELRDKMQLFGDIRVRAVPFIFLTTSSAVDTTIQAYLKSVQGFFTKPPNLRAFTNTIKKILDYWGECTEPTIIPTH